MLTVARSELEGKFPRLVYNQYLGVVETAILLTLVKSVKPRVMIEFGCQQGRTAKNVLNHVLTLQSYIGIDVPSHHVPTLQCQRNEVPQNDAGWFAADDKRFHLLVQDSLYLAAEDLEPCDAVFIDGDHSAAAVMHDSVVAHTLLRPGGIIVWHDYNNSAVQVTLALNHLVSRENWPIVAVKDSWLAFCRI